MGESTSSSTSSSSGAGREGVSALLEALLQCYIHTCSYDAEEHVWVKEGGALHKVR